MFSPSILALFNLVKDYYFDEKYAAALMCINKLIKLSHPQMDLLLSCKLFILIGLYYETTDENTKEKWGDEIGDHCELIVNIGLKADDNCWVRPLIFI